MPTPAESGFRHGWSTMPKLRVGMPPMIFAIMPQMAKMLHKIKVIKRKACGFHDEEYFALRVKQAFVA